MGLWVCDSCRRLNTSAARDCECAMVGDWQCRCGWQHPESAYCCPRCGEARSLWPEGLGDGVVRKFDCVYCFNGAKEGMSNVCPTCGRTPFGLGGAPELRPDLVEFRCERKDRTTENAFDFIILALWKPCGNPLKSFKRAIWDTQVLSPDNQAALELVKRTLFALRNEAIQWVNRRMAPDLKLANGEPNLAGITWPAPAPQKRTAKPGDLVDDFGNPVEPGGKIAGILGPDGAIYPAGTMMINTNSNSGGWGTPPAYPGDKIYSYAGATQKAADMLRDITPGPGIPGKPSEPAAPSLDDLRKRKIVIED